MKKFFRAMVALVFVAVFSTGASAGSAPIKVKAQGSGSTVNTGPATIEDVRVNDGASFSISGKVRKLIPSKVGGHVDFAAFDASGKLLQKGSVGYSPALNGGRSLKEASFNATMPGTNGKAALLAVEYHGQGSLGVSVYDCGNNKAASGS